MTTRLEDTKINVKKINDFRIKNLECEIYEKLII